MKIFKDLQTSLRSTSGSDVAVVIDYSSLMQQGPLPEARPPVESSSLTIPWTAWVCLRSSVRPGDTAHSRARSIARGYDDRGWTLLVSIVLDSKSGPFNNVVLDASFNPDAVRKVSGCLGIMVGLGSAKRRPVLSPDRFGQVLETRR